MANIDNTDLQLERAILAQMMSYIEEYTLYRAVTDVLAPDDFTSAEHQTCYSAIMQIVADGGEVSLLNVYTYVSKMGKAINLGSYNIKGKQGDLVVMAVLLHEMGVKRRIADSLAEVLVNIDKPEYSSNDAVADVNTAIAEASRTTSRTLDNWQSLHKYCVEMMRKKASGEIPLGIQTDYSLIDNAGGLEEGSLLILAGRTSNGKTAFALNLAMNVALKYTPVVLYSLEMTNEQVGNRLLAALTGIAASSIKKAELQADQWDKADKVGYDIPLYFDDRGIASKDELYRSIRNAANTKHIRLAIIDYLQLIKVGKGELRVEIGKIANELKELAKELRITIVLLSQLAREAKGVQPLPRINELKESGEIENAADAIYFVYRPEQHSPTLAYPDMSAEWSAYSTQNTALLICAKNRLDKTGEQILHFDRDTMRFWQQGIFEPASRASHKFEPI